MKKLIVASAALVAASTQSALACAQGGLSCQSTSVPEISALEGTAALTALAAVVLLAWERRRRAA